MEMKRVIALMVSIIVFTNGCASMFHGTSEQIHVRSEEPNTRFFMNEREIGKGTTAVTTIPKKDLSRAILRAEKEGFNSKSTTIPTEFDAVTLLGILIDCGLISILVVDFAATGATDRAAQNDFVLTPEAK